ncbi:MAG: hypothetical protein QOH36_1326 [Actinomycetota bacterium]|nr:hypothetical protein [Actinomycetota bacterium]
MVEGGKVNFTRRVLAVFAAAVACSALATVAAVAASPPGGTDLSFGSCGVRIVAPVYPYQFQDGNDGVKGLAVLPDGRILLAGNHSLTRLLPDGLVDHSFGLHGVAHNSVAGWSEIYQTTLALQPDGRILVGASLGTGGEPVLSRYLADGRVDPSFGDAGHVTAVPGSSLALQPDGRILAWRDWTIVRLTATGALDPTFGTGGRITLEGVHVFSIRLQPDGKLVLSGATDTVPEERRIFRLAADGTPDPTFGTAGTVVTELPAGIRVDAQGRIVWVTDQADGDGWRVVLHRLLPSGQPDPSVALFASTDYLPGWPKRWEIRTWALDPDSRVVAAVTNADGLGLVRLDLDGHLDRTFGAAAGSMTANQVGDARVGSLVRTPTGDWLAAGLLYNYQNVPVVLRYRGSASSSATPTLATCSKAVDTSFHMVRFGDVPVGLTSPPAAVVVRSTGTATARITRVSLPDDDAGQFAITADGCTGAALAPGATCSVSVTHTPTSVRNHDSALIVTGDAGYGSQIAASLWGTGRGALATQAWGWNLTGELGTGSPIAVQDRSPVVIPDTVAVAAGYFHSLALRPDGTVWAWGWNYFGQLGDGSKVDHSKPAPVPGLTGVVAIAAGAYHSLAITADGTLWAWGLNHVGQLGDGTTIDRSRPVRVGIAPVRSVSGGAYHSLAVLADGTVSSWGWNVFGQLGDGTTVSRSVPQPVPGLGLARSVAAGGFHSLAVLGDESVKSWGLNHVGQLGDGTTTDRQRPVNVPLPPGSYLVAAGAYHSVVGGPGSTTLAWGWNAFGQVGDGTTTNRLSPVVVAAPDYWTTGGTRAISAGVGHTLLLGGDGRMWGWGWNGVIQLGRQQSDPHRPEVTAEGLSSIAAGGYHSLGG